MYCLIISSGAPPQEAAKYEGLHSTFFQYLFTISGRCLRRRRLDTPFRLLTREEMEILGGYSISRCTWSSSPFISTSTAPKSSQTFEKMKRSRSMASSSNTFRLYLATKTRWICTLKTQCLPCRISLQSFIYQTIIQI